MNREKINKIVENLIAKTEDKELEWSRLLVEMYRNDSFIVAYLRGNDIDLIEINSFIAKYNQGYVYLMSDDWGIYLVIQPNEQAALTGLKLADEKSLRRLKSVIEEQIDNPESFLDSLLT